MTLIALPQAALCTNTRAGFAVSNADTIRAMCERITSVGLLNPLLVSRKGGGFEIVDGRKRFFALRKLARAKALPRTLHKVPCYINDNMPMGMIERDRPALMSEQELAHHIIRAGREGANRDAIMQTYDCSATVVGQARALGSLHPKLMLAFINGTLDLAQSAALATLPSQDAQWNLLVELGPFAKVPEIIAAIADGTTVLDLPNGETMILPSRAPGVIDQCVEMRLAA